MWNSCGVHVEFMWSSCWTCCMGTCNIRLSHPGSTAPGLCELNLRGFLDLVHRAATASVHPLHCKSHPNDHQSTDPGPEGRSCHPHSRSTELLSCVEKMTLSSGENNKIISVSQHLPASPGSLCSALLHLLRNNYLSVVVNPFDIAAGLGGVKTLRHKNYQK